MTAVRYRKPRKGKTRLTRALDFFKEWTAETAYVFGLLMADGAIPLRKGVPSAVVLELKDEDHVRKVAQVIDPELRVWSYSRKDGRSTAKFSIGVRSVVNDCTEKGLMPQKSLTVQWPIVPDRYLRHFVRGYFDGNGTIGKYNTSVRLSFSTGSAMFAHRLQDALNANAGVSAGIYRPAANAYNITAIGVGRARLLGDWMYQGASLFLDRKWNRWVELTEHHKTARPAPPARIIQLAMYLGEQSKAA